MRRMHIHVGVENIDQGIKFYSAFFGEKPAKTKSDYAKWMLDDIRINFAISTRAIKGAGHLGSQVDESKEMGELRTRLKDADMSLFDEGETVCCYTRSDKTWVTDPAGIAWEAYQTMEDVSLFSEDASTNEVACCIPESKEQPDNSVSSEKTVGCCSS